MIKSYYQRSVRLVENCCCRDCCYFRLNQKFAIVKVYYKYTNYIPKSCRWLTTEQSRCVTALWGRLTHTTCRNKFTRNSYHYDMCLILELRSNGQVAGNGSISLLKKWHVENPMAITKSLHEKVKSATKKYNALLAAVITPKTLSHFAISSFFKSLEISMG